MSDRDDRYLRYLRYKARKYALMADRWDAVFERAEDILWCVPGPPDPPLVRLNQTWARRWAREINLMATTEVEC